MQLLKYRQLSSEAQFIAYQKFQQVGWKGSPEELLAELEDFQDFLEDGTPYEHPAPRHLEKPRLVYGRP